MNDCSTFPPARETWTDRLVKSGKKHHSQRLSSGPDQTSRQLFQHLFFMDVEKIRSESPIERMMLVSLLMDAYYRGLGAHCKTYTPEGKEGITVSTSGKEEECYLTIRLQYPIDKYRADFFLQYQDSPDVVVECDGHDYHERTKAQAAHDRKRDRELQRLGFRVFRFTGSEIWADCIGCAVQVIDQLQEG